jgi:hypothetical protein
MIFSRKKVTISDKLSEPVIQENQENSEKLTKMGTQDKWGE